VLRKYASEKKKSSSFYIFDWLLQLRIESNNFLKIVLFLKKIDNQKTQKTLFFHQFEKINHHLAKNSQNKKTLIYIYALEFIFLIILFLKIMKK
jgi:hypothetical protein